MASTAKEETLLEIEDIKSRLKPFNEKVLTKLTSAYNRKQRWDKNVAEFKLQPLVDGDNVKLYLTNATNSLIGATVRRTPEGLSNAIYTITATVMRYGIRKYIKKAKPLPDEFI